MRFLSCAAVVALGAFLASCNSMSKEECAVADWGVIGDTDGAAGYNPQDRFASHVKSCTKVNITPDQTKWYAGYQEGVKRYCTPLSGAAQGEGGRTYHNVCPAETEAGFMRGYSAGKRVHDLRSRMESLNSSISSKDSEADRRFNEMKAAKDDQQRRTLRSQIDDLERDSRRMKREYDDVAYDLREALKDLEFFRQNPEARLSPVGY